MTSIDLSTFDYKTFQKIVEKLSDGRQNLRFVDTLPTNLNEPFFIIRHDIDFCPIAALEMARLESKLGIKASYFLLFNGPTYNLLAPENIDFPKQLVDLGHEVGLHYDVPSLEACLNKKSAAEVFEGYCHQLECLSGEKIRSVAMHNPSLLNGDDPFGQLDYIYASDRRFTKDILYLSDSCGAWRNEADRAFRRDELPQQVQLLIHPIFWGEQHKDRLVRVQTLFQRESDKLINSLDGIRNIWSQHQGVIEHDQRIKKNQPDD